MLFLFRRLFFILVLSGVSLCHSYGQAAKTGLVSGDFREVKFEEFAQRVEAETDYRFFFDSEALDTLLVTLVVKEKPLEDVLGQVFKDTDFKFSVSREGHVFVTTGTQIYTALPDSFFLPGIVPDADRRIEAITEPYIPTERRKKVAVQESKLYDIGLRRENPTGKANIAGHLKDVNSGEPIIGAYVYILSPQVGTASDQYGYYSLTLPVGRHEMRIKGIGLKDAKRQVMLYADGKLDIEIEEDVRTLKEVVIEAEKDRNVSGMQMGMERLDIRTIKQVPTAFGETDILRVMLTLPGVKSVGEGSTGMNVRGGSTDQNLILFNDATIYNPSHLFGFFSAFNPDMLKSVELYKSAIPAKYGGRLSSVLEITAREGNKKKLAGAGGIGLLTSRLTLEGPIIKDKTSFIIGGRSTYSDWLLKKIPRYDESSASFYDINANISHEVNSKNSLYLTGYTSKDKFNLSADTVYRFTNYNGSLKWKHIFHNKLYSVVTGSYSHYSYSVASEKNPVNAFTLDFGLNQQGVQADFNYFPNAKHTLDFGGSSIAYTVAPGSVSPNNASSLVTADRLQAERGIESALYVSDRYDINRRISISVGLRYSFFSALGGREIYNYAPGVPKSESTIQDTTRYGSGERIATYHGPEYRVSARMVLTDNSSFKLSYNRLRQYIHMLSNTASISPTDIWKLSDSNIKPQVGDQFSIGYYRNLRSNTIEFSAETYYKKMHDFLDYRSGAVLVMNHHIETDVVNAEGEAYGVEFMLKKLTGKLNGWVSYTYARTLVRLNDPEVSELINGGKYYPSNFDKPHDFTFIGNYRFSQRFSTSLNFTYNTGRPITLPIAKYSDGTSSRILYSDRNQYRIPDYHRVDFALNIEGNHKIRKLAHSSWTLAVYNLTGRRNPYSVYFKSEGGRINGYKLSIFGHPIPTVTYNFRF